MNKVVLTGRLTKDPDVRYTNGGNSIARFTVAVDRRFKSKDGNGPDADFPSVVAFGKTAEFLEKYFHKGMKINLIGRIQTGSYKKEDGTTVYTTDVVAEEVEFGESRGSPDQNNQKPGGHPDSKNEWMNVPDDAGDDLPFI